MQFEQGANPSRVKAANQAAILKTIYHCAPIKRSEIAQRLGLTLPTITTNINSMMARGIVRETGSAQQEGQMIGRKAPSMMHKYPAIISPKRSPHMKQRINPTPKKIHIRPCFRL